MIDGEYRRLDRDIQALGSMSPYDIQRLDLLEQITEDIDDATGLADITDRQAQELRHKMGRVTNHHNDER